jgi:hypothetical protein
MKTRYYFTIAKLVFITVTPGILLLLPASFFDNGRTICLSQLLFHRECYACGMTRGIMHLVHLQFEEAYAYNMLSFIVLPLLIVIWIQWFLKELRMYKKLKAALRPGMTA